MYAYGYGQQPQSGVGGAVGGQAPMAAGGEGRVVHVSNINSSLTSIAHLFNLFSLCGSVARIKFVYTNTSQALIEYVSAAQASLAVRALNKATLGGQALVVAISKHSSVQVQAVEQGLAPPPPPPPPLYPPSSLLLQAATHPLARTSRASAATAHASAPTLPTACPYPAPFYTYAAPARCLSRVASLGSHAADHWDSVGLQRVAASS
jgi:hypothetical protein